MEIYCSTGVFLGRINQGNERLLMEDGHRIACDGFELMLFPMWYERLPSLIRNLRSTGLRFPVLHADKRIGDLISSADDDGFAVCLDIWKRNLETACAIGAKKVVTHIWGVPDSDLYLSRLYTRVFQLRDLACAYRLDMLAENCCCVYGSPLMHLKELLDQEPGMGFTIDTRPAQFHRELAAICATRALWQGAVRHLHISDFHGSLRDWNALYPIPAPGCGDVNYPAFFSHLKQTGYQGTLSLESPCMHPDRLDWETINSYLDFIRKGLQSHKICKFSDEI